MAKKLNDWLDEFVDNGAASNKVADWPEDYQGGNSYEPGNGINIENNTISIDEEVVPTIEDLVTVVANPEIGELDNPIQLENLQVGENKYWIPTKTSDLNNDSEFITINDVPEVEGTNDGTNWTSITIGEETHAIPQGSGTEVTPNPSSTTATLNSIGIDGVNYALGDGTNYGIGKGLNLTQNNIINVNDAIINLLNLITVNNQGKTVLRTKTGNTQYVLADSYDPNAIYYERVLAPVDSTKLKGTWIINSEAPQTLPLGSIKYYFISSNSQKASDSRGYSVSKQSSWIMYNYYDVVIGSNNSMLAADGGQWYGSARTVGYAEENATFLTWLQANATKVSDLVLGEDGETYEEIINASYIYQEIQLTPATFTEDTYYIQQNTYDEILVETIINYINQ